jgi:hypothetical protein
MPYLDKGYLLLLGTTRCIITTLGSNRAIRTLMTRNARHISLRIAPSAHIKGCRGLSGIKAKQHELCRASHYCLGHDAWVLG